MRNFRGKKRDKIFEYYRYICVYCGGEADVLDHIVPYSYLESTTGDNLVPACNLCNLLASDMYFDSFEAKKEFILSRRNSPKNKARIASEKSECTNCGKLYKPRNNQGSTIFLCEDCADIEYERKPSKKNIKENEEKYILEYTLEQTTGCLCTPLGRLESDLNEKIE